MDPDNGEVDMIPLKEFMHRVRLSAVSEDIIGLIYSIIDLDDWDAGEGICGGDVYACCYIRTSADRNADSLL